MQHGPCLKYCLQLRLMPCHGLLQLPHRSCRDERAASRSCLTQQLLPTWAPALCEARPPLHSPATQPVSASMSTWRTGQCLVQGCFCENLSPATPL